MSKSINKKYAKYSKRPLIATSLAIALGVSVASGVTGVEITDSQVLQNIEATDYAVSGDEAAGLLINPTTSPITLRLDSNISIADNTTNHSDKNISAILLGSGEALFASSDTAFKSITVDGVTAGAGKIAYIFKNTGGNATFKNVGLIAGAAGTLLDSFGVYSNLVGARYDFGNKTIFQGTDATKTFVAFQLAANTELGGNVEVVGAKGANALSSTEGVGIGGVDGKQGQSIIGIKASNSAESIITIAQEGLNLKLVGGDGGEGNTAKGGVAGQSGNITGIDIDSSVGSKITISGGDIAMILQAGNRGSTATTPDADAIVYAIKNEGTSELVFDNGASLLVGEGGGEYKDGYALLNNIQNVQYDFGSKSGAKTILNITGDSPQTAGVVIEKDATFSGALEISADGAAEGSVAGIKVLNSSLNASATSFVLSVGNTNANNASALELLNSTFSGSFTIDSSHAVGNDTNTLSSTLIKNTKNSTIASGVITLASADGLKIKSVGGIKKVLDNTGILTFGAFGDEDTPASNAVLQLGSTTGATPSSTDFSDQAGFFANLADVEVNFGEEGAKTIFNLSSESKDVYGAYLANQTTLGGNLELNALALKAQHSVGIFSKANQTILGDIVVNANSSGEGSAASIGFASNGAHTLTLSDANTIILNSDSMNNAVGVLIDGGKLTIQNSQSTNPLGISRFTLNTGSEKAINAVALALKNNGAISGDIVIDSGKIGNEKAKRAIAVYVDASGVLENQSIVVGNDILSGEEKYIIKSAKNLAFTSGYAITGGDASRVADTYGLYNGITGGIYSFEGSDGATFEVSAKQGNASAILINTDTTINGKLVLTVSGSAAQVGDSNGGNAIGLDVRSDSLIFGDGKTKTISITADGGTKSGEGKNGSATAIKLASGTSLDASQYTLTLQAGKTTADHAIALDMDTATFSGSFVADGTNTIGNANATSATLIKNTGNSSILTGSVILEESAGLIGMNTNILDNTGVLTFGTLGDANTPINDASLTIGTPSADIVSSSNSGYRIRQYGFSNSIDGARVDFGSTQGAKTVFNVQGADENLKYETAGIVLSGSTTFAGNVEFNVTGGVYYDIGYALGMVVDAKGGNKTLTLDNASITFNADTIKDTYATTSYGLYVYGGVFKIDGNGVLKMNIGTQNSKYAYGFYVGDSGTLDADMIDLSDPRFAKIGNENADRAVAVGVDSNVRVQNGFSLVVADGVLLGKHKSIFDNQSYAAITFANDGVTSHKIIAGDASHIQDTFGIYSGIADVDYSFGSQYPGYKCGSIFKVVSNNNAYGAIIAKNANFRGTVEFNITSKTGNATAIRLDDKSTYSGALDLSNSTIKASKGEAIAILATGEHTITNNIKIGSNTLVGATKYVFKNTGSSTTFNGSLITGTASGNALIGIDSNVADTNYDFGTQTIFNTIFASTSFGSNSATGVVLKDSANFAGNVIFNVEGQNNYSGRNGGDGIGLSTNAGAATLGLANKSSIIFNVDSGVGDAGTNATGIQIKNSNLTIQDAQGNILDTSNFIFNVGTKNATTAMGIDIQAGGSIAGDLVIAKGKIGNSGSIATAINIAGSLTEQSIIVADGILNGKTNYVYNNLSSTAINFKNGVNGLDDTITAGDAQSINGTYGLYSGIEGVGYDFGANKTVFTVAGEDEAIGAIITKDAFFENKVDFVVDAENATGLWIKDSTLSLSDTTSTILTLNVGAVKAKSITGLKLENGEFYTSQNGLTLDITNLGNANYSAKTKLVIDSYGTSTISGKGLILNGSLYTSQEIYLDNHGELTFDNAELIIANSNGAFTADNVARVGLSNAQFDSRFEFGKDKAKTTFAIRGNNVSESGTTNIANANAIGALFGANTIFSGNVVFDVQGGVHTDESNSNIQTVGSGTGFDINTKETNLTLADKTSVTFRVDSGNGASGVATGLNINNVTFNVTGEDKSVFGSSAFVFNVGNTYATTTKAINLSGANAKLSGDSIVIKSGSVIGNTDYATTATAIHLDNGATITNQSIVVEEGVRFLTKKDASSKRYILNNAANTKLSFSNDANATSGNHTITVGQVEEDAGTYGLYSNIADVSYNFGTTPAEFSVKGKDGVSQGEAAAGLVLGASARFEGEAKFTVVGGSSSEGVGGNAYGIQAIGGDTTLTVAQNASLTFDITGGEGASQKGKSVGIFASNGTLTIAKEGNGVVSFGVGDYSQNQSAGVELDHGVFDGSVTFSAVKAKDVAYGILNDSESIIKNGEISFASQAFKDVGTWSVIENQGKLTISRDATITAGTNSASIKAALFNGIDKATYNLGSLNLEAGSGKDFAIYSANDTSVFNVAGGSNVDISAVDSNSNSKGTQAFGGSINLNLEGGKATNIYLNTDGGEIKNLIAGENATIYLSGTSKSRRVGGASKIDYRTLSIDLMSTNPSKGRAAATEVQRGANFVVLVDSDRKNGTTKNALTGAVTHRGPGAAYGIDGNASLTGGSDRIVINYDVANMPSVRAIDSGLGVGISSLNRSGEKKYAVLAQVANNYTNITNQDGDNTRLHNLVTFNGLKKDGDVALVTSQVGFDVATIAIERHDLSTQEQVDLSGSNGEDWSNVGAVYVSDMIARSASVDADVANSTISAINTNFDLVSANLNSLSKRLGELRNTDNAHGLWGRVFAGQQTSKFGIEQTSTYLTFQAGYDYKLALENASNYVGFALSYVHSSSKQASAEFLVDANGLNKIAGNATSASSGVELAVYNTYVADSGLYSDSIVKFGYFSSDLNIPAQSDTYGVDNLAVAISEEVGYKVSLGEQNEWFITPQAELAYAFINGSEFTQYIGSASLNTKQGAISMFRTRIGAAWGYNFDHYGKDKGIKASLYLGTYYAYDGIIGGKTNMHTSNGTAQEFNNLSSNGRFVLNVGTDVAVQDSTKFYVDFEKSFGNMMQTDYQVSVGVRFGFGAKTSSKKADATKTALKPKELDESAE